MPESEGSSPEPSNNSSERPPPILTGPSAPIGELSPRRLPFRRGWLGKYTNADKSVILWKACLAVTVFSITLSLLGLIRDQYDNDDEVSVKLEGFEVTIPSVTVSTRTLELGVDGCANGWKVNPSDSKLHSIGGMSFAELADGAPNDPAAQFFLDDSQRLISTSHSGNFAEIHNRALIARIFSIIGVSCQILALVLMIVGRTHPSALYANRPLFDQPNSKHLLGSIIGLILFLGGLLLFMSLAIMSSLMAAILSRVGNFALDWCSDSPFDHYARGQSKLEYMIFLGNYIQDQADAQGVTYMTFAISIFLVFAELVLVFYLTMRQVLSQARINYALPPSQLRALPWYSKIRPLWISILFLVCAIVVNCATVYSARVRGYPLNLFFYNYKFLGSDPSSLNNTSWSLPDAVLDFLHTYVVDKSVVKMMLAAWIPMMAIVGLGAIDTKLYISKVVEGLATLLLLGALIGIFTVPTTPAFVLQKPQCYIPPVRPPTFIQFISISESCNDQMYSIYSILITFPIMMIGFYVRYGAISRKKIAYLVLALACAGSMFTVVATRQQYVVDVYVGVVITFLYAVSQTPAYKLLFRFGTVHPGLFNSEPVVLSDKVVPVIEDCTNRFELFFMAGDPSGLSEGELQKIADEFNNLLEAIEFAKTNGISENATEIPAEISSQAVQVGDAERGSISSSGDAKSVTRLSASSGSASSSSAESKKRN